MSDQVRTYIEENLHRTIKPGKNGLKPFTVPSWDAYFSDFYYWDTYFTDLALLACGEFTQVRNNLDNMKLFVERLGYVPNADFLQNRSQPPLFARAVFDYYIARNRNKEIAEQYLPAVVKEHEFWMNRRLLPSGLNGYGHCASAEELVSFCLAISERVGENPDSYLDKSAQGAHFLAIAESGWDFTPRFAGEGNRYAGADYAAVDLNAILYQAEIIVSALAASIGQTALSGRYLDYSVQRKALMDAYMLGEHGLYYDYNEREKRRSALFHAGMFFPFAAGISKDASAAETLLKRLDCPFGMAACEKREDKKFDQWDYPSRWAPLVYLAVEALAACGSGRAAVPAGKFLRTVRSVFRQTGQLWEKYDATTGSVAVTGEYETPPMMGWTAGVYLSLLRSYVPDEASPE